ncbi:MAG: SirB2 family protein [Gammaproteobacteria bacterium]|jgi:uncharacterized membrane protein SirB2
MLWLLKVHVLTVTLSISGFVLRLYWMWRESPWLHARWVRIAPHVNDTLLLLSGISLAAVTQLYPWQQSWLLTKLVALIVYILLGMVALRLGLTRAVRLMAGIGAIAVFVYIVAVAKTRSVVPL